MSKITYRHVGLYDIIVGDRYRKEFKNIPSLARKILSSGGPVVNLIAVDEHKVLLAGERRLRACKLIAEGDSDVWGSYRPEGSNYPEDHIYVPTPAELESHKSIPVNMHYGLTDFDRRLFELQENLDREDFVWQEQCHLVYDIHTLCQKEYGVGIKGKKVGWAIRDTAQMIGMTPVEVLRQLQLYEGLKNNPEIGQIGHKSTALAKSKRLTREKRGKLLGIGNLTLEGLTLVCGDSKKIIPTLSKDSVDIIITDPPWGIDVEERMHNDRGEGYIKYDTGYDVMDTRTILKLCSRVLRKDSCIYMFYSAFPEKVIEGQALLVGAGFQVESVPLIWNKKHVLSHMASKRHPLMYEVILYGWKGERPPLNFIHGNVFDAQVPFSGRIHSGEKPKELIKKILQLSANKGETVLDPWGGSCIVADAALEMEMKAIVIEKEESLITLAKTRLGGIKK